MTAFSPPALRSRWPYSLAGVALLCCVIWYLGPLLPGLENWPERLAVVLAVPAIWGGAELLLELRHRARERALTSGLADDGGAAEIGERAAIEAKMSAALALLKRARGKRGYLYEQPWYAIIGGPGTGKTTALLNAGLNFPLAAQMGRGAVAGVGGTRLCEWWFTDQAVLIDTAGRYTTQDSDAAVDRAGWDAFLALLKRTRPRQPLNGLIVAVALSDIAQGSPEERAANARAIRQRIDDLENRFALRLPVYALFTKADLLAGFMEFFDDLDREGRGQVWGVTFPLATTGAQAVAAFATALRELVERLGNRLVDRLQAEQSPERRALVVGFPTQVASLEAALTEFIAEAFGQSNGAGAPMLRGVYLTSATQEGTPIDRLTGAIARTFGLSQQRTARLRPEEGRIYFLSRLLRDVIFNEATLVSGGVGRRRRRMLVTTTVAGIALLLVAGTTGVLWHAYATDRQSIDSAAAALSAYAQAASALPLDPVAESDLSRLAPLLDRAKVLRDRDAPANEWLSVLSQDEKLIAGQRALYRHLLEHGLFPRLIWRLETQLRGNRDNPEFLYEATRVYLMLGGVGPMDPDLMRDWMKLDWQVAYPGAGAMPLRSALARHLDALLADPLPAIVLDGELVAQARATFGAVSLAQRVYSRLRSSAAAQGLPPWRPADSLGPAGLVVFVRASARSLDDGVPGFYTIDGFHNVLLPALGQAIQEVLSESWVLGRKEEIDPKGEQKRTLEQEVIALYETDYAKVWDAMLADLNLVPMHTLTQAAQELFIVSSDHSPLRALLASVARQLTLSEPPASQQRARATASTAAVGDTALRLQMLLGAKAESVAARPGHEIDGRYKALRDLVGTGAGAPIEQVMRALVDLQQQFAKLAAAGVWTGPPPGTEGDNPALTLQAEALRQPQPLARWLATAAASGLALRHGDARQQVIATYNIANGPAALCAAINDRYPFAPTATSEIPLDDFTRLFAPGGVIDGFFNTLLRPYVDVGAPVWKPKAAAGVAPPVSQADVAQFQRAAEIRDLFFASGQTRPEVRFDITPISLDARANQATLDFADTSVVSRRGVSSQSTEILWPGANAMQLARFHIDPPPPGTTGEWRETGSWAMFRLLGRGRLAPAREAERSTLTFQMGDRRAEFEIRTGTRNPLARGILEAFRCPVVQ